MTAPPRPDNNTSAPRSARDPGGLLGRLRAGLASARQSLGHGLSDLLLGARALDASLLDDLESLLLSADIGIETTEFLLSDVAARVGRKELADTRAVYALLRQRILEIVQPVSQPLRVDPAVRPFVIMAVGVNGVGKTTTIAKLAHQLKRAGHPLILAAGDTFRAAAVDQLKVWAQRLDVPLVAQPPGSDAAAVAHDALHAARARATDVLIVDTAGRQHTHAGLMDELKKIKRVLQKIDPAAPHEVMLVLDASTGQNAISQLKHFHEAVGVTGIALTKLDGTAKGGILIAIARQYRIPLRFVGVGEGLEDLQVFNAGDYVEALLPMQP